MTAYLWGQAMALAKMTSFMKFKDVEKLK